MLHRLTIAILLLASPCRALCARWWERARPWRRRAAELAALRVALNDQNARIATLQLRLDQQAELGTQLARTIQPVLQGQGAQLLDLAWWVKAMREVSTHHRRTEIDRVHDREREAWRARHTPAATADAAAEGGVPADAAHVADAAAAAIDDLAVVQEACG